MDFIVREPNRTDIVFYKQCFTNQEFHYNMYNNEPLDIEHYGEKKGNDLKFIFEMNINGTYQPVSFVHFYFNRQNNIPTVVGGIEPTKMNSGLGAYIGVTIFDYLFSNDIVSKVHTGVYKFNRRSYKMLSAIGFKETGCDEESYIMEITPKNFDNEFVKYLKQRIVYKVQV